MTVWNAMHLVSSRRFEPQRVYNFEVEISGLSQDVRLSVVSFPLPKINTGEIELAHGNTSVWVAGKATFEPGDLVVRDAIGADIEEQLNNWRRMVYNENDDRIGWAVDYQKQAYVYQYSPDASVVRKWRIFGLWPTAINFGEMSAEVVEKKVITMTMRYNKAIRI